MGEILEVYTIHQVKSVPEYERNKVEKGGSFKLAGCPSKKREENGIIFFSFPFRDQINN